MSVTGYINVSMELWGSLLSLTFLVCVASLGTRGDRTRRRLMLLMACNAALLTSDACAWLLKGHPGRLYRLLVQLANFSAFLHSYLLYAAFASWLIATLRARTRVSSLPLVAAHAICAVSILLLILSQFNGMFYFIDESNLYRRGPLFWLSQLTGILGQSVIAAVVIRHRGCLSQGELMAMLLYIALPILAMAVQIAVYGVALLNIAATVSLIITYLVFQAEQNRRYRESQRELEDSRIAVMLSQIQPHFLFNALTAIISLCDLDARQAKRALADFSSYLRMNLDTLTQRALIPFEQELKHIQCYLALEKMRLSDRLSVSYDIRSTNAFLPPLTVQPLVENAVRHGVSRKPGGGKVTVSSWEEEDRFIITVEDDGAGFDPASSPGDGRAHIGLQNVHARLAQQINGTLHVVSAPGKGTKVTVILPGTLPKAGAA